MSRHKLVDRDGVRVCAVQCATCIFRPGDPMHLRPGRVKSMVEDAIGADGAGSIVCHKTLDQPRQAVCRGFYDGYADRVQLLQVARRMGFVKDVAPEDG